MGTAWAQSGAEPVSRLIIGFSWWWVIGGLAFWSVIVWLYYRTFLTDVEKKNLEARRDEKRQVHKRRRLEIIQDSMESAMLVAQMQRQAAEEAAQRAEAATDAQAAGEAAEAAAAAAVKAEDAAIAAIATSKALRERWVRKALGGRGRVDADDAENDAAAARAAAERAAHAALARGAIVRPGADAGRHPSPQAAPAGRTM